MGQFSPDAYDALERAIANGGRLAIYRRGTEFVVVPERLRLLGGREAVECVHPTTGDHLTLYLDEVDSFEVVG